MALVGEIKKGGRYTKKEQEQRKIEVYHLHFEQNKSAVKIAELLDVNRNTINEDIHYWHQQLAGEFQAQDLTAKMTRQIQRMEIQRDRLLDDLEEADSLDERIRIERFISDIDNRLTQLFSKMISQGKTKLETAANPEEESKEEKRKELEVQGFVRDLILEEADPKSEHVYSENELKINFIKKTKSNLTQANKIMEKMKEYGLSLFEQSSDNGQSINTPEFSKTFNLAKFVNMRGYLTKEDLGNIIKKCAVGFQEIKRKKEERFIKKYGPKTQWSREIRREFRKHLE